ncbi:MULTISPECIES: RES family NAD+ phosphorylase [unclassified Leeuwenhoekiella]|uniref:RES family NAD+ phosphorylase n=1 Tax=unclassified Leeuwenhoekiella TaxID=2615029 RepID=UPI000C3A59CD|nr:MULTISPECIES: RES family NAD+ phosphorylase [unclassified Leeuwenhoekiella]MAW94867.1 RES superfamily protein [Leeuwenhoekiella sp.]MBA79587.1 RES superfamily protein [Leeuwenhoekiella sp.]|tara:strand:+ start:5612 stop:6070 length:459 start_codon:yes stop_codon:yes gene_type:complete
MLVYRLSRKKYADSLSGKGAALRGARWNSKGVELVYTAQSRALALAEVAVHLSIAALPSDFMMLEIFIPDTLKIKTLKNNALPEFWNDFPYNLNTKEFGDQFVTDAKFAILKVPSAVVLGDFNYLINLNHPDAKDIKIQSKSSFPLDKRIFN